MAVCRHFKLPYTSILAVLVLVGFILQLAKWHYRDDPVYQPQLQDLQEAEEDDKPPPQRPHVNLPMDLLLVQLPLGDTQPGSPNSVKVLNHLAESQSRPAVPPCEPWRDSSVPGTVVGYDHTNTRGCDGPACVLNIGREPVKYRPTATFECGTVETCVTLTVKTRFRHKTFMMYFDSLRKQYPKLKVIVMDEIGMNVSKSDSPEFLEAVVKNGDGYCVYAQAQPGVGHGRRLAAQIATTKYILVSDDDYNFQKATNLEKLLEVLESTDLGIVGGETSDLFPFSGAMRVTKAGDDKHELVFFHNVFYERIPCSKSCYVVDQIKTFFMANREVILRAGSWDVTRKHYDHEDFFMQMRHSGVKVGVCKDVLVTHMPREILKEPNLAPLRKASSAIWRDHLFKKWNISDLYICPDEPYLTDAKGSCTTHKRRRLV